MPSPPPLQPNTHYHIFNRGTNRENIFREDENYRYILKLYAHHVAPIAETFAYCLMPNHFHLLIRTKSDQEVSRQGLKPSTRLSKLTPASQAFSNLFNAYTLAFNKRYNRTGSLFEHPFHRIAVMSDAYFTRLIAYIHRNPAKHGFTEDFRLWTYSSYAAILSVQPTQVAREKVLTWFDGSAQFRKSHEQFMLTPEIVELAPDDFD
jgi:REP element-mobilizing transposase RayT